MERKFAERRPSRTRSRGCSRLSLQLRPALINGAAGAVATLDGEPYAVTGSTIRAGRIVEIDILADAERLRRLDLTILEV